MKRTFAPAALVVLVTAGMSACGSTQQTNARQTTSTVAPTPRVGFSLPPAVNHVILPPLSGAGNERLGSFTPDGTVDLELSCKGAAHSIAIVGISRSSPCDGNPVGIGIPGEEGRQLNLVVRVAPGTTWRLAVGEEIPEATLRLVDTTAAGSRSFGTFAARGTLHYKIACRGPGSVRVELLFPKTNASRGDEGNCVGLSYAREADVDVQGDRVRISVDAPRKTRWSLTVSER